MQLMKLNIQLFADGKVVIETDLDSKGFKSGLNKMQSIAKTGFKAVATSVGVVSTAITAALGGMVKIGSDFEAQMSRVKAISGATEEEFDKLKKQAMDLGKETAFSSSEAAQGMENLAAAGFSVNETMEAMPGLLNLAAASGEDLSVASDIAAAAVRGFGLEASETAHVADVLAANANKTNSSVTETGEALKYIAPFANAAGISLEETAAAIGIMANAGIQGSQAGTTLRGALSRLSRPTDDMIGVMNELGISFYDTNGKMKPLSEQVKMLEQAMSGLTDEQRNNYLVTLYGQESLSGMLALINEGSGELSNLTEEFKNADGAAKETAETMQDNLKGSIEQLGGSIETLGITIFDSLSEPLKNTTNEVTDIINNMTEAFEKDGFEGLATAFADGFTNILTMLVEKAPEVANVALTMIQTFITAIQENLPTITNSAMQIITSLVQGILTMLPQILQMGIQIIVQLIQGIAQQAPTLIPQIIDCIMLMVDTILDNLDLIIEAGIELILALTLGLIDAIPKLLERLPEIIVKIVTKLTEPEMLSKLIGAALTLIIALAGGLIKAIPELIAVVPRLISELVTSFINKIKNTDWKKVGKNLVEGLWNGIKSVKDWILDKISGFVDSIVGGIKKFFGIKSPSRLMRDEVGKFVAQGIGVGFEDELSNVYDDMQKAVDLETEKMSATVQTGNVYNKVMNTTPVQVNGTYTSTLEVNGEVLAEVVNEVNDKRDLQYMF